MYDSTECWDDRDLEMLQPHAAKVWSLELHGDEVDDAMLDRLPVFPKLEILELRGVRVVGSGLATLARHPRLRVLRTYLPARRQPVCQGFRRFDLDHLDAVDCGLSDDAARRIAALFSAT